MAEVWSYADSSCRGVKYLCNHVGPHVYCLTLLVLGGHVCGISECHATLFDGKRLPHAEHARWMCTTALHICMYSIKL